MQPIVSLFGWLMRFFQTTRRQSQMSTRNWKDTFADFLEARGKIQQLAELKAVQALDARTKENLRNSEAESAYVRKHVWGDGSNEETDMNDTTILGNVTVQKTASGIGKAAALAALLGLPVAGLVAGYLLVGNKDGQQQTFDDTTVELGLSRIEDVLGAIGDDGK